MGAQDRSVAVLPALVGDLTLAAPIRVVAALAVTKVLAGVLSAPFAGTVSQTPTPSRWFVLAQIVASSAAAAYLALGARHDRRAAWLASSFVLGASAFGEGLVTRAAQGTPAIGVLAQTLAGVQTVAFLPYASWTFFSAFPHGIDFGPMARWFPNARRLSAVVGSVLFVVNALPAVVEPAEPWRSILTLCSAHTPNGLFWPVIFGLTVAALGAGIWNARRARAEEQRRVRLLTAGLVLGSVPILAVVLVIETWPPARAAILRPSAYALTQWIVYPALLSVPLTTAYAVHVHQALDVGLYLRRALQYALARYTVLAAAAAPVLVLLVLLYQNRDQRLTDLLAGRRGTALIAAAAAGVVVARTRQHVLDAVDRRFFREQYDARVILRNLAEGIRRVGHLAELEQLVTREIDRALHVETVAVLVLDASGDQLASRLAPRPLPQNTRLAALLRERGEPLQVDLDARSGDFELPEVERAWLAEAGFRLLVPLLSTVGALIGLVGLGAKRSELPFGSEDHALLGAVGSATAVVLEQRLLGAARSGDVLAAPAAGECRTCGRVSRVEEHACSRCGGLTAEATVPLLLAGKFLLEERIGAGGMGVVYRARDLSLSRTVAIKTLRPMGGLLAGRLRREARAMAAVTHPHLAAIHGLESWSGTPLLVVEYLAGGTLASRIARGPLPLAETFELGLVLVDVAQCIHRAGILHRDIKPSNIGFTANGTPKLLDFGLARMMDSAWGGGGRLVRGALGVATAGFDDTFADGASGTATGVVLGTPQYMAPEAVAGGPPDPTCDLWSIAVVLYESLAGRPPFRGTTPQETLSLIRGGRAPNLRDLVPTCPPSVAEFFLMALEPERSRRLATTGAMKRHLLELRAL